MQLFPHRGFGLFLIGREIDLCQRNDRTRNPKVFQNLQMFLGLRHPAVVSGDGKQGEINRANTRHHIFDEVLVARHVNDPGADFRFRKFKMRESEIDRDATGPFLRQTVRVGASEGFHQRALAVVDVPGSGDDEMLLHRLHHARATPASHNPANQPCAMLLRADELQHRVGLFSFHNHRHADAHVKYLV